MQKVAKELLPEAPKYAQDILPATPTLSDDFEGLSALIHHRQASLLLELAKKMSRESHPYDAWMHRYSDLIQACARSFGERVCWDSLVGMMGKVSDQGLRYRINGLRFCCVVEATLRFWRQCTASGISSCRMLRGSCWMDP